MAHQMGRFSVLRGNQVTADRRHRHLDAEVPADRLGIRVEPGGGELSAQLTDPLHHRPSVRLGEVRGRLDRGSNAASPSRCQRITKRVTRDRDTPKSRSHLGVGSPLDYNRAEQTQRCVEVSLTRLLGPGRQPCTAIGTGYNLQL